MKHPRTLFVLIAFSLIFSSLSACQNEKIPDEDNDPMAGDPANQMAGNTGNMGVISPECMLPVYEIPTTSDAVPIQELATRAGEALCLKINECCNDVDRAVYWSLSEGDEARCQEYFKMGFEDRLSEWIEAALAGTIQYDSARAQEYLDYLNQRACDGIGNIYIWSESAYWVEADISRAIDIFQSPTSCLGGPCIGLPSSDHGSCDPEVGFCCVRRADQSCAKAGVGEEGECVAVSRLEEPCSSVGAVQLCQGGVSCSDEWNFMTESGFTCGNQPPGDIYREGDPCDGDLSYWGRCEVGTYCVNNQCTAPKEDGETCMESAECLNQCVEQTCRPLCQ